MKLYQGKRNKTTGLLLGLLALISVDIWMLSTAGYGAARVFTVLFLLLALVLRVENVFYLYIFCFPFSGALKFSANSISVLPLINMIVILRLLWKREVRVDPSQILSFFFLLALQLVSILLYGADITNVASFFVSLFFVICCASYFRARGERTDIFVRATVLYTAAIIASVVLSDLFPDVMSVIAKEQQVNLTIDGRFGAIFVEPNEYSQAVLVGIGLLISIFPMLKKITHKATVLAALVFLCINGYRSISKSYVLTLLGMFIVFMILNWYRIGKYEGVGKAALKVIPMIAVLVVGSWILLENAILPTFVERDRTDFLTGRGAIWLHYLEALWQRIDILFMGSGVGNTTKLAAVVETIGNKATHNIYLEYLIQFGVLGMIFLVVTIAKVFKQNAYKLSTHFLVVLAAYAITAFGISANANDCIFLIILMMEMPFAREETKQNRHKAFKQGEDT